MIKNPGKVRTDIRRDQIANAALRIIGQRGVSGLTTAALAREAGISEANLYRHFTGKDEILAVTVEKVGEGLKRNINNVLKMSSADSPLIKLKRAFMLHLDYIEKNEGIPRLVFSDEMHLGNEELKQKLLQSISSYSAAIEILMKEGQKAGLIKKDISSKMSAVMFIGMIQVTTLRWSLSNFSFPLVTEGMKLWETYEKCIKIS